MASTDDPKVTKIVKWPEVVARTFTDSGIPKKQIEETVSSVAVSMSKLLDEGKPQKVNTASVIITPLGAIRSVRIPAETRVDTATGKKIDRPECISVSMTPPREFVKAANIGLVAIDEDTKKKKNA